MELETLLFPEEPQAFDIDAQPETYTSDGNEDTARLVRGLGLWVKNTTGAQVDVTLPNQRECNHDGNHPALVAVPDGFEGFIATRFLNDRFGDANQFIHIQYSAPGLRVAAVKTLDGDD